MPASVLSRSILRASRKASHRSSAVHSLTGLLSRISRRLRREKLRISEAQDGGGLLPRRIATLNVNEAAELYLIQRQSEVSASTIRLERDALKQVKRHLGTSMLWSFTADSIASYVSCGRPKASGTAP